MSRRGPGRALVADLAVVQAVPDRGVLSLVGGDRLDLGRGLRRVEVLLVALEGLDHVAHRVGPERPGP